MTDLSQIAGTLKYGKFDTTKRKTTIISFIAFTTVIILGMIGLIVALTLEQINRPDPMSTIEFTFLIVGVVAFCSSLPITFLVLNIKNEKIKNEIILWLQDAVELGAFCEKAQVDYNGSLLLWTFDASRCISIKINFKYNGKHYTKYSGYRDKNGVYKNGFQTVWASYADKSIKILYSPKYDEVIVLKNNDLILGELMIDLGDWKEPLKALFEDERYQKIRAFLKQEYSTHIVYPDMYDIFNCFRFTPFSEVKAVLLGQDPYHEPGQAHGLCFSVQDGVPKPPSLENMLKELKSDLGYDAPKSGNLTKWAKQGVLLMNTALTVREHQANSHANCGWSWFTDSVISLLNEQKEHLVFILWGGNARRKVPLINQNKHLILQCAHPSPLSAYNGFFGCRHYSKTNEYLTAHGIRPIDWNLCE